MEPDFEDIFWSVVSCFLLIGIFQVMSGCSSISTIPNSPLSKPDAVFKKDLSINVNGKKFEGVGVLPRAKSYSMEIESKVDVDLFTVTTCHRDFSTQDAINVNWVHPKRSYIYSYTPISGIEDVGSCLVRIAAFNKDKGATAFAVFDLETEKETLPAKMQCNGVNQSFGGVSVCQSREGLIQNIEFETVVDCIDDAKNKYLGVKKLQYEIKKGEHIMACRERDAPNRIHRHTDFGFTDYILEVK